MRFRKKKKQVQSLLVYAYDGKNLSETWRFDSPCGRYEINGITSNLILYGQEGEVIKEIHFQAGRTLEFMPEYEEQKPKQE